MENPEPHTYIKRVKAGDRNAFAWIVDRYGDMVHTLCQRMLRDGEEAADAAQEVFIKVFKSLGSFQEKSRVSTWIYRIAYNHCISEIRKRTRVIDLVNENPEVPDEGGIMDGLEMLACEERKLYLKRALEALPETDSVVVTLFYIEELNLDEIAGITGLSNGNVRIRLHRARKKLFQVLGGQLKSEISNFV